MERALLFGTTLALAWIGQGLLRSTHPIVGVLLLVLAVAAFIGLPRLATDYESQQPAKPPRAADRESVVRATTQHQAAQTTLKAAATQDHQSAEQPTPAARRAQHSLDKPASHAEEGRAQATHSSRETFSWRTISFIAGVGLVCIGQYRMLRDQPLFTFAFSQKLNDQYHIGVANPDNVVLALILFVVGGFLYLKGAQALTITEPQLPGRIITTASLSNRGRPYYVLLAIAALLFAILVRALSSADYNEIFPLVWITTIALIIIAGALFDRRTNVDLSLDLERSDVLFMLGIFLAGLVVGIYQLDQVPNSMMGDEGAFFETARSIAIGDQKPAIFSQGVYSYPILGSIYQAWILKLFGNTLWAWRFGSVLAAVLAIFPTYLFAREVFTRRVAVLACAVMIVTPYFIAFERLGYNNSQSIFPVALALYLLYAGFKRGSALYLALSGVLAGLGFYTYTAGRLGLLVAVLFMVYLVTTRLLWRTKNVSGQTNSVASAGGTFRTLSVLSGIFLIAWGASAVPNIVYSNAIDPTATRYKMVESLLANVEYASIYYPEDQLYRDQPPIVVGGETFFYRADLYGTLLTRGVIRSLLVFWHNKLVGEHFINSPLAGFVTAVFFLFGLLVSFVKLRHKGVVLLMLWFFGGLVVLSVIHALPPRYQHIVPIIPAMAILIALGIVTFSESLAAQAFNGSRVVYNLAAVVIVVLATFSGLRNYFVDVQAFYQPSLANLAVTTVLRSAKPQQLIYVTNDPNETNFMPWLARNTTTDTGLQAITPSNLTDDQLKIDPGRLYTFFFHEQDVPVVVPFLEHTLDKPITPQTYYDTEGRVIGLVYSFSR
jgi:4-amino-4-deoxy-L-arabinose transferase-like glycosyltransferase